MKISYGFDLIYELPQPTAMSLLLHLHPSQLARLHGQPEQLVVTPNLPTSEFIDAHGNRCTRLFAPAGEISFSLRGVAEDSGVPDPVYPDAEQHPVQDLPSDILRYLLPSRYCEVDKLGPTAWSLFSHIPPGWERAQAVCAWVNNHITFGYHNARKDRTAAEGLAEKVGVCRDFTHLAITFTRCLNIPARYATGYLGDIGVPAVPDPMDFSAWYEVYLGGRWHTFDARHNARRIGRMVMAYGRDAADAAFTTSFGPHVLKKFFVITDEVPAAVASAPSAA